ncbi:MAG: hypothetical protein HQK51_18700 [Oligoflexia bacterium]|nr:hypothetical protein [Oligoflexia bacterium]
MDIHCFRCGNVFERDDSRAVARSEECPHCGSEIRCCKMCEFYDPDVFNECRELMAERVVEKDKANFCNYYRITDKIRQAEDNQKKIIDNAESLFKKK